VFGLYGGWGEGKTSALNLLQCDIAQDDSLICVVFNPWYLASEAALIQSFYVTVEQALQQRYRVEGLHSILNRYARLLTSGLNAFGLGLKFSIRDNPEHLRKDLEDWIGRTGCRLVILIDDIDRLSPAEVLAIFKLVGLSARIQHAVFVLSFDVVTINAMLRERISVDPTFLEKFIQKPLQLPAAEQRDIHRFLLMSDPGADHKSGIDMLLDELKIDLERRKKFDDKIVYFYYSHLSRFFRTIRQAKRYLNSLRAQYRSAQDLPFSN
jgi:hypothetical protein